MKVKIRFLHNARPYTAADEYANITIEIPEGALPNTGDIVSIEGIKHPLGSFVVSHRVFYLSTVDLCGVELVLGVEGGGQ